MLSSFLLFLHSKVDLSLCKKRRLFYIDLFSYGIPGMDCTREKKMLFFSIALLARE
jgi:hypothetical protein